MAEILTRNLPLPLLFSLLALAAGAVVLLYRRDRRTVSPATGRWLLALRLIVGAGLLVAVAEPVRIREETTLEKRQLLVAVDSSRSFLLREPFRAESQISAEAVALGQTREIVKAASRQELATLALESGWLEDLRLRFALSLHAISDELRPLEPDPTPLQGGTDILRSLADELSQRRSQDSPAGVVLVSDGRDHGPGDAKEKLARLTHLGIPVITIGVGALELPPDLVVESVDATGKVFANDEVNAQITLATNGLKPQEVTITVLDGETGLGSVTLPNLAGDGRTNVTTSFKAGAPGRKKLTVRASTAVGEVFEGNNSRDLWLDVLSTKARVLLLDGSARWEERYLRTSWSRDENVELQSFLVTAPPERRLPSDFPRSRDALLGMDVIVLGDVEPGLFAKEEIETLRDFVAARGGTLVLLAGERSMPYKWADTPLAEAMPVRLLDPPPPSTQGSTLAGEDARPALTLEGQSAEITRLVPGREQNLELWELLPPPRWICPVAGVSPGTQVLATARDAPLFAWRAFGSGKVFWAGIDSTWKWRYKLGDELHRRFWGQVVRWAVSRQLTAADDLAKLSTGSAIYAPDGPITVEALLLPTPGQPEDVPRVDAIVEQLSTGRQGRLKLEPIPRSGGRYEASSTLANLGLPGDSTKSSGEYRVRLDVPSFGGYSSRDDRAAARFVVEPEADAEAHDLGCDVRLLTDLAQATGGKFLAFSRYREAANELPADGHLAKRIVTRSLIEWPGLLATVLLGGLAIEWILRKRQDLV